MSFSRSLACLRACSFARLCVRRFVYLFVCEVARLLACLFVCVFLFVCLVGRVGSFVCVFVCVVV